MTYNDPDKILLARLVEAAGLAERVQQKSIVQCSDMTWGEAERHGTERLMHSAVHARTCPASSMLTSAGGLLGETDAEAGMLLLDPASVQAALLPRPLSLLMPPAASISFQAVAPSAGMICGCLV